MAKNLDHRELWQMSRSKIQYSGSWIQQRVSWHLVSTAFLFSAFVTLVTSVESRPDNVPPLSSLLLVLIPIVGAIFSILVYLGIRVNEQDVNLTLHEWRAQGPGDAARKKLPDIDLPPSSRRLVHLANSGVSVTAIALWLILTALSVAMRGGLLFE
jgi:hypothetical protein